MHPSILKYLPHRPPMQMVDTITLINDTSIVTCFQIKEDCIFLCEG
ncbi:MAG: acyl carrier protein, partial [Capnocytophaga sp.]